MKKIRRNMIIRALGIVGMVGILSSGCSSLNKATKSEMEAAQARVLAAQKALLADPGESIKRQETNSNGTVTAVITKWDGTGSAWNGSMYFDPVTKRYEKNPYEVTDIRSFRGLLNNDSEVLRRIMARLGAVTNDMVLDKDGGLTFLRVKYTSEVVRDMRAQKGMSTK